MSAKGRPLSEREWMFVEEREGVKKFVEVDGFVFGVGGGEVRAGDETGAERDEEKHESRGEEFSDGGCAGTVE